SDLPGGTVARWLLPLGLLIPLAGGLLHLRNLQHHLYGPSVAIGLATLLTSALFVAAVWICAAKINHGHAHLRRRERLYAVLSECNQTIIRVAERPELFGKICASLVETGEFQAAWIAEASPSSPHRHAVAAARGLGAESLLGAAPFELPSPALRALAEGGRTELGACPGSAPWDRLAPAERPSALALFPLRVEGRTEAVLVVHAARRHAFDADHLLLLDEVAGDISHALGLIRERRVHRQAEQRLHDTALRLNEALAKNPTLFYSLHVSPDGTVIPEYVSENVNGILGYSVAEAMQPAWWTSHLHPDDVDRPHTLSLPPADRNILTRDFRFQDSDGSYVWIRDEQRVVRGAKGEAARLVGSWSDITERIHMEEQFRHAQKFESLGRLAGGVAHDLNNILTVVDGHASLLEASCTDDAASKESIDEILLATKRATRLTRQLLTFSKKQFIEPRNINLNAVVADMGKMLKRTVGEDIEIVFEGDPSLPAVFADEGMVEQILLNLVVNARDAMPKGGAIRLNTARARIERNHLAGSAVGGDVPAGDYVRFSVADTGCGIPPSHLAKIFDPFFTTKEPGKGTGLGLATVRSIVRQHGGTLTVTSEPNRGTTFHIYLPVATTLSLAVPEKRGRLKKAEGGAKADAGATILLVEDDEAVRSMMKSILAHMGHRVVEAPAAREAMEAYGQHPTGIDLLLTDVVLPGGLSGRDLAVQLRSIDPGLPVLYVTGYPALPKEYGFGEDENRDFLRKPFASVDLIEKVRARLASTAKVDTV
ncbi:MAG TPA: ATP-binding protein, partial [Candidatus Methylacidiphilales bacterium]